MSRLSQIQKMLESSPNDVFLQYALAMEWRSLGQTDQALELFQNLMNLSPGHVPSYFMAGQLLVETGAIDQAREVLRRGIDAARVQGDRHAAGEMAEFLGSLGELGE